MALHLLVPVIHLHLSKILVEPDFNFLLFVKVVKYLFIY